MSTKLNPLNIPYRVFIVFTFLMIGIIAAGYIYYVKQKAHFVENIKNDLLAITVLKVGQIANWRKERLAETQVIVDNRIMSRQIREFLDDPRKTEIRKDLLTGCRSLKKNSDYSEILLVNEMERPNCPLIRLQRILDRTQKKRCWRRLIQVKWR